MAKDKSSPAPVEATESEAIDKVAIDEQSNATEGTLYVFPNWNGSGKSIRVKATNRKEAIEKATAKAKKEQI